MEKNISKLLKRIKISEIENVRIGHFEDYDNGTGCTVIICEKGAATGVDVRGGGPASKETELLNPVASAEKIHSVVLTGGSAFGLDSASGVMKYLEEKNIGFSVGSTVVPLVCASAIFDLNVKNYKIRPDKEMGYKASIDSENKRFESGCIGAGTGATVGKFLGPERTMKSGLGCYAIQIGDLKIGAVVIVNALGDIFDVETGEKLAGLLSEDKINLSDTEEEFYKICGKMKNIFTGNTTIGAIITNAEFNKIEMKKIAAMSQNGFARTIVPVHTTADGDSIYALSVGEVEADINVVGTLASYVMGKAINEGVRTATSMYGYLSLKELKQKKN